MKNEKKMFHKENFWKLLEEYKKEIFIDSRYADVTLIVGADPRYKTLDEKDREETFQDYMEDYEKKQKAENKEKSRQNITAILQMLHKKRVGLEYTWAKANEELPQESAWAKAEGLDKIQ